MICALCAAENPIKGRYCLKCGALLQGQRELPPQPFPGAPVEPYSGPARTSGKAIGSLVCGLIFFFFPSSIVAIILGHLSLAEIRGAGGRLTGRGMAKAGLILGYLGVSIIPILIVAAIAIPNLLRSRFTAKETAALRSLRSIVNAEKTFDDSYANGYSPNLATLGGAGGDHDSCDRAGLIDDALASGQKNGYTFTYVPTGAAVFPISSILRGCTRPGAQSFEIRADPIKRGSTGRRSFYVDQTGVVRYSIIGRADSNSAVLARWRF